MFEAKLQRWIKIFVVFMFASFALFVAAGNYMDWGSNYAFIHHVMMMDDLPAANAVTWRAIKAVPIHVIGYCFLIFCETCTCLTGYYGTYKMIRAVNKDEETFAKSKTFGYVMFIIAICIWYGGFSIIGSEWFDMWQSKHWNAQMTAYNIVEHAVLFMIILWLPTTKKIGETAERISKD
ncbi:DUF2165 domain-containing protein [Bifidobacterium sp. ESL0690]|uniref:DUF2165 domain-containing protein n=1 Tax=Bifidobacterium sp. ESL0690 TaxID=2983214 RepID=UPI0023F8D56C|nr:DUF2165 domain-containing protein [Bifidobacterium sp. ESL0690]WEV47151.1 DUF2165 domain-containing protein [Bifidobacterium sp. ESL0690]